MTNPFFQLGVAFAALVLLSLVALEGKDLGQSLGLIAQDDPVLVFTIPQPDQLANVRKAIVSDRVIEDTDDGFSVQGGRVYVKDVAHAGPLIKTAGWVDQPIHIVGLGMDQAEEGDGDQPKAKMTDEERLAYMRKLVHKPTLTRGEQMFVLKAMNDGLEI